MSEQLGNAETRHRYSIAEREAILAEAGELVARFDQLDTELEATWTFRCEFGNYDRCSCGGWKDHPAHSNGIVCSKCHRRITDEKTETEAGERLHELREHEASVRRQAKELRRERRRWREAWATEAGPEFADATVHHFRTTFDADLLGPGDVSEGMTFGQVVEHRRQALEAVRSFGQPGTPPWLVLAGAPGRGKSLLVAAKLAERARRTKANPKPAVIPFRSEAWWCSQWKAASDHRFDKQWDGPHPDEIVEAMLCPGWLILDDLGDSNPSPGWRSAITEVLYERHRRHLPTLVTTNLLPPQVAERYDAKVWDRMDDRQVCRCCHVPGPSFRRVKVPAEW